MSAYKFSCSHCQQHLQCEEQFAGREIECPACHHLIRIPPVPGKTVAYQPEVGKTWATFVSAGKVAPPKGLSLKKDGSKPS